MLYEKAKAEVDANQGAGGSGSGSTSAGQAPPYASLGHAPQASTASSSSNATVTGAPKRPPASADDEKAQLKRYWEAQDAVARHQQQQQDGAGNSHDTQGSQSMQYNNRDTSHGYQSSSGVEVPGAFPTVYQRHELHPSSPHYSDVSRDMSRESSHAGDDSASIISLPYR